MNIFIISGSVTREMKPHACICLDVELVWSNKNVCLLCFEGLV